MPKQPKSPQEKKRLSLERDHRNTYGANDKSSRKNIPRSKAISHRITRRTAKQASALLGDGDNVRAEVKESTLTKRSLQKGKWRKGADTPLGEVIQQQKNARTRRDGRKESSRALRGRQAKAD